MSWPIKGGPTFATGTAHVTIRSSHPGQSQPDALTAEQARAKEYQRLVTRLEELEGIEALVEKLEEEVSRLTGDLEDATASDRQLAADRDILLGALGLTRAEWELERARAEIDPRGFLRRAVARYLGGLTGAAVEGGGRPW